MCCISLKNTVGLAKNRTQAFGYRVLHDYWYLWTNCAFVESLSCFKSPDINNVGFVIFLCVNFLSYVKISVCANGLAWFSLIFKFYRLFFCRTTFFMKENKYYTHVSFFLPFSYLMILGFFFTENSKEVTCFNNCCLEIKFLSCMQLLTKLHFVILKLLFLLLLFV